MASIVERLEVAEKKAQHALSAVRGDSAASHSLHRNVERFHQRVKKTLDRIAPEPIRAPEALWGQVVELEELGRAADQTARSEADIRDNTRRAVRSAHREVDRLRDELGPGGVD